MSCNPQPCSIDPLAGNCIICLAVAPVPEIPASVTTSAIVGWDGGANSITELSGDIHTVFSFGGNAAGALLGFRSDRTFQSSPAKVEHGWYATSVAGIPVAVVMEHGVSIGVALPYTNDDVFEIRRVGATVSYWKNGAFKYTSSHSSYGVKLVNACLYASGSAIE